MKLLAIDYHWSFSPADYTDFSGNTSCYDYDVVIWDPAHTLDLFNYFDYFSNGGKALKEEESTKLLRAASRRKREFQDFLAMGRTLFIIARDSASIPYQTGKKTQSGTGRNSITISDVSEFKAWSAAPVEIKSQSASGKSMSVVGDGVVQQLVRKFLPELCYESSISADGGAVVARIPGTERVLSAVFTAGNDGRVIVLPVPSFASLPEEGDLLEAYERDDIDEEDLDETGLLALNFQQSLIECASRLSSVVEEQPEWAQEIHLIGETELVDSIASKEKQIDNIRTELSGLTEQLLEIEYLKNLVSGTGRALELAVKTALEALGGRVEESDPGRDDWIVHFSEGVAVVEVKGLGKSAGERNATQLEKWVLRYHDKFGEFPKGILVINAWRNLPLPERTEDPFPNQMLPYAVRSQHCLITGAQLLAIHQHIARNPDDAAELRQLLLSTSGIFPRFADVKFDGEL